MSLKVLHMVTEDEATRGEWYVLTSQKQHIDVRVTPTGLIRIGEVKRGRFPIESWTTEAASVAEGG